MTRAYRGCPPPHPPLGGSLHQNQSQPPRTEAETHSQPSDICEERKSAHKVFLVRHITMFACHSVG